jgi:carboxymethylenebutenolidase
MTTKVFAACAFISLVVIGSSNPAKADGKAVKITSGTREYSATLYEPAGSGPFPAVVEVHGIFGRVAWDDEVSEKLTQEGYITLSVDLYGMKARDYDHGLKLRDQVHPHVGEDLRAAVAYLRTLKEVSSNRIGALGWCMGGGFVLQLALAEPTLTAGVIYYGPVVVDEQKLKNVRARLIGFFGQEDRSIPVPAVRMMANSLKDLGNPMELQIYPDTRHGFAEPEKGANSNYRHDYAEDSWKRTLSFLATNLSPKK